MLRVLLTLIGIPMILGVLWFVGSTSADLYYGLRLRAEYRAALEMGETAAPDARSYVRDRLPPLSHRACIVIGLFVVAIPLSLVVTVILGSMNH